MARPADIDTSEYRRAHGREPRGTGLWAFIDQHGGTVWMDGRYSDMVRKLLPGRYTVGS